MSSSLWAKRTWKMYLLVVCEILGHFLNTLTAGDKYCLCNSENLRYQSKCNYTEIIKLFLNFLLYLWNQHDILNILKKKMTLIAFMYFRNSTLWKTSLDNCLKSPVSEHPATVKMWKDPKHLWNLHDSTFIKFLRHSLQKWLEKCLSK